MRVHLFDTDCGAVAIIWAKKKKKAVIKRIMISIPGATVEQRVAVNYPDVIPGLCEETKQLSEKIKKYCGGEPVEFTLDNLDFSDIPEFREKVYKKLFETKRGETLSYGELAALAGYIGAARAVGTAMKNNPFPFIIPCHRVIKADGSYGKFFGAEDLKKRLIEEEKMSASK